MRLNQKEYHEMAIRFDLRSEPYQIVFRYREETKRRKGKDVTTKHTVAIGRPAKDRVEFCPTFQGEAICHPCDIKEHMYDKGLGRRLALARLLRSMNANRNERTVAWTEYFRNTTDLGNNPWTSDNLTNRIGFVAQTSEGV